MIGITIDQDTKKKLSLLARLFPRQVYAAVGRAGSTLRSRLRKVMLSSGGIYGVTSLAPHSALTQILYGTYFLGNTLAYHESIQMYRPQRGAFTVGWVSGLKGWASAFQDAESRPYAKDEITYFHRIIGKRHGSKYSSMVHFSGKSYQRPARPIIEPFSVYHQAEFSRWVLGSAAKTIDAVLEKRGYTPEGMRAA